MIDIKDLKGTDRNRPVVYKTKDGSVYDFGTILRWNTAYVFVDYTGPSFKGIAATDPKDLTFLSDETGLPL